VWEGTEGQRARLGHGMVVRAWGRRRVGTAWGSAPGCGRVTCGESKARPRPQRQRQRQRQRQPRRPVVSLFPARRGPDADAQRAREQCIALRSWSAAVLPSPTGVRKDAAVSSRSVREHHEAAAATPAKGQPVKATTTPRKRHHVV
jgi:hypothetical protein